MQMKWLAHGLGAGITGLDLNDDIPASPVAAVRSAWLKQQVLVFPRQNAPADRYIAVSRQLGEIAPVTFGLPSRCGTAWRGPTSAVIPDEALSDVTKKTQDQLYAVHGSTNTLDTHKGVPLFSVLFARPVQPKFICGHRRSQHDRVMWDNCCTLHLAVRYDMIRARHRHRIPLEGQPAGCLPQSQGVTRMVARPARWISRSATRATATGACGVAMAGGSSAQFSARTPDEAKQWKQVVAKSGATVE